MEVAYALTRDWCRTRNGRQGGRYWKDSEKISQTDRNRVIGGNSD